MNIKYKFKNLPVSRKESTFEGRKVMAHSITSYVYNTYGSHPLTRRTHRRDLSTSLSHRLPSSITRYPDFKMAFYESMRMSFLQIKKVLESIDVRIKSSCGRVLINSLYYRCLDCEVQHEAALATVYCPECYAAGSHEGHRVIAKISGESPSNCDCGNGCVLKEEGFCPNHGQPTDEDFNSILSLFPESLKDNLHGVLANVFYALFNLCEEHLKKLEDDRKDDCKSSLDQLLEDIIALIKELYKINPYFKIVISRFLMKNLEDFTHIDMLSHNCENSKRNEIVNLRRVCKCTYLTNILRYNYLFSKDLNTYVVNFIADLLGDHKFRLFFSDCVTKYLGFLFPLDKTGQFDCFGLENFSAQAYIGEASCEIILRNNIHTILDIIDEMINTIPTRFEDLKNQHIATLYAMMNFIHYIPEKKLARKYMMEETDTLERLIDIASRLQNKHMQYIIDFSPPFILDGWNYNVAAFSKELELSAQIFRTLHIIFTTMGNNCIELKQTILVSYKNAVSKFLIEKKRLKIERKKSNQFQRNDQTPV